MGDSVVNINIIIIIIIKIPDSLAIAQSTVEYTDCISAVG